MASSNLLTLGYEVLPTKLDIDDVEKSLEKTVFRLVLGDENAHDPHLLTDASLRVAKGYSNECIYRSGNTKSPKLPKTTGRILSYLNTDLIHARTEVVPIVQKALRKSKYKGYNYYRKLDYCMYKPPGTVVSSILYEEEPTAFLVVSVPKNNENLRRRKVGKGGFQFLQNYCRYAEIINSLFNIEMTEFEDKMRITDLSIDEMNEAIGVYTQMYYGEDVDSEDEWVPKIREQFSHKLPYEVPEQQEMLEWVTPVVNPGDVLVWNCPYRLEKNDSDTVFSGLYISLGTEKVDFTESFLHGCVNLRSNRALANIEEYTHLTANHRQRFKSIIPSLSEEEIELYSIKVPSDDLSETDEDISSSIE